LQKKGTKEKEKDTSKDHRYLPIFTEEMQERKTHNREHC
jgi:hypothetical protein